MNKSFRTSAMSDFGHDDQCLGQGFILTDDVSKIAAGLASMAWVRPGEVVETVERAGAGNMNCVLRVTTSQRSFILKQSRPWVEKYPGIPAPLKRADVEALFYQTAGNLPTLREYLPQLLRFDAGEHLLMLEDLEGAEDLSALYSPDSVRLTNPEQMQLVDFLLALHTATRSPALASAFGNTEMRLLNHEHIFALPLRRDNGLDLDKITPGLTRLANDLQDDLSYCREVTALGQLYLATTRGAVPDPRRLLPGELAPGAGQRSRDRSGVLLLRAARMGPCGDGRPPAHQRTAGGRDPKRPAKIQGNGGNRRRPGGKFAGVEIMRRLIGLAQLPVIFDLERKAELLRLSKALVLGKPRA